MPVYAYYDADTEGEVYHVVPDSDGDDDMSTLESQTESMASATTIQSDDLPGYFVLHHGRQQPAADNIAKFIPTDNIRRYILRYLINKSVLGGDYLGPVRDILAPVQGKQKHVLELGTKTGTWVQSMAIQFPHVQFCSVDVVPIVPHVQRPNIMFEVYNYTEGLRLRDESQDAVFINCVGEMVKNYPALLRDAHRVLRTGGFIHITELSIQLWDPEDLSKPAHRTKPITCGVMDIVRAQMSTMGMDPDAPTKLSDWLAPTSDIWIDTNRQNVGFKQIEPVLRLYPTYPHDGYPCASLVEAGLVPFIRHMCITTGREFFSVLRDRGIEDKAVEEMIEASLREIQQPERCGYLKLYCVYAVKR
ncbi:methyltransferase domain protein [Ceratobasidium sp. AG-Ba]|nr:methyltransferase domain protein [Ceratobasidium sp. AG-Ba]